MSAASMPSEVRTAMEEDPDFADDLGRARARLMRVEYDPSVHHPYRRRRAFDVPDGFEERMAQVIDRFRARGAARVDRPNLERAGFR